jgi:hypothetical protein
VPHVGKGKETKNVATVVPRKTEPPKLSTGGSTATFPTGEIPSDIRERHPRLDSFDALMSAMDAELARSRPNTSQPQQAADDARSSSSVRFAPDSSAKRIDAHDEDEDEIEADLDAELDSLLKRDPSDRDAPIDYTLIKNLLESYKSQAGMPGPASNLAGRLDPSFHLPRDSA